MSDLTGPGMEPKASHADSDIFNNYVNWANKSQLISFKLTSYTSATVDLGPRVIGF